MEDIEKAVYLSRDLNNDFEKYMKNKKINIDLKYQIVIIPKKAWTLHTY